MANDPPLTGHVYDGIQEYDNPMPGWWKWLFAATIVFAGLYYFVATATDGQLGAVAEYESAATEELKRQFGAGDIKADAVTLLRLSKDADSIKMGASIFQSNCVACHNRDGAGLVGPNLTDDYYINVRGIEDIFNVVSKGRNNGAMPAWDNRLSPAERVLVSGYVASLRGQNKPGKGPEGIIIPPWSDISSHSAATQAAPTSNPTTAPASAAGVFGATGIQSAPGVAAKSTLAADPASILRLSKDPSVLKSAKDIYLTRCMACHGPSGAGLIGPNLTDDYYINVRKIADIPDVITKGRKNGLMPQWGTLLNHDDIVRVSAYVASLRGKNRPGKPPEKEAIVIPPWSDK